MKLSFHGGVDGVTGSCHLLEAGGLKILVDCGMFQGGPEADERNHAEFGFNPEEIDYLLLTHGHLDHCGRVPLLVKRGFRGRILTTEATYDVAKVVLMDAAHLQEEDYEHWQRIRKRKGQPPPPPPLYDSYEALDSFRFFTTVDGYDRPVKLNEHVKVTFRDAGHIIGSSFLEIKIDKELRIVFSGDIGNRNKPIIKDPQMPSEADIVVLESTYGNRNHRSIEESLLELKEAILDTCQRGGNVLIPAFAIERAQDLLFYLRQMSEEGQLPDCNVFLDSPMAISITKIMRRHPEVFDRQTRALVERNKDPFSFPGLVFTRHPEDSKKINFIRSRAIIIAGSGMCTGGRIKHHLKHNIWRPECSVVFVGFQARGTLGRRIVDGEKEVPIFGERYRVEARIYTIGGFSAHADRDILLDWLEAARVPEHLVLVHGETEVIEALSRKIKEQGLARNVHVPKMHGVVELNE
ncbi:MAG: MBL fold metallo-hydrolase [Nitrospirae bacterium]|nr:MAG: MBL fold metallo-hydrolase [Nitrospirota bacterium]